MAPTGGRKAGSFALFLVLLPAAAEAGFVGTRRLRALGGLVGGSLDLVMPKSEAMVMRRQEAPLESRYTKSSATSRAASGKLAGAMRAPAASSRVRV